MGHALLALAHDDQIVWTHVSQAMQAAAGADDDASSEVTDYLSSLGGFRASVLFKERRDGTVKVSLRAAPPTDVAAVAQQFGGGGHRQAAGCTIAGSIAQVEERVLTALRASLAKSSPNVPRVAT
jgi:phosphoesterase RecJ-like protein